MYICIYVYVYIYMYRCMCLAPVIPTIGSRAAPETFVVFLYM